MAYLDIRAGLLEGLAGGMAADEALSSLELRTLQLSQADGRASLRAPRRIERLGAMLFGSRRLAGLANPGLEALRRFAILYRLDGAAIAAAELERARAAGLSAALLDRVRAIVDGWPRRAGPVLRAATLLAAAGLVVSAGASAYFWLAAQLEPAIAAILLGALAVTLARLFAGRPRRARG